jgi:hypothetical protein
LDELLKYQTSAKQRLRSSETADNFMSLRVLKRVLSKRLSARQEPMTSLSSIGRTDDLAAEHRRALTTKSQAKCHLILIRMNMMRRAALLVRCVLDDE